MATKHGSLAATPKALYSSSKQMDGPRGPFCTAHLLAGVRKEWPCPARLLICRQPRNSEHLPSNQATKQPTELTQPKSNDLDSTNCLGQTMPGSCNHPSKCEVACLRVVLRVICILAEIANLLHMDLLPRKPNIWRCPCFVHITGWHDSAP